MTCKNCGNTLTESAKFCTACGTAAEVESPAYTAPAQPAAPAYSEPQEPAYTASAVPVYAEAQKPEIPEENKPLSPWAYWGYSLLFAVPVVGFIFLIIFSCKNSNINRRNFARSYWCNYILAAAILLIMIFVGVLGGVGASVMY